MDKPKVLNLKVNGKNHAPQNHKKSKYTKQLNSVFISFHRFELYHVFFSAYNQEPKLESAKFEGWENICLKTDHTMTPLKYLKRIT